MKLFLPFFTFFLLFFSLKTMAQQHSYKPAAAPEIHIKKALTKITLDGKLDETDWSLAELSSPFWESIPYDTSLAISKTEVKLTFDDNNLYVAAKCYQKKSSYIVQSLRRDFPPGTTDLFGLIIDPFCDKQNGFSFVTSPFGVQREGLISNGNEFSTDWDNKWSVEVQTEPEYFTVEIAIPFKTLRYQTREGANEWFVNFFRYDQSRPQAERSNWSPLPRFSSGNNVAFTGKMIWDDAPPKPSRRNISFIPYALGSTEKDIVAKKPNHTEGGVGFDGKVAVTSSLNLDLTMNPDFAQVEVDKQQTNLSRFELFFPERRQFFLENSDLFGSLGFENINPFFSRRIGFATDSAGNAAKVPIIAGARLTGKLDKNWRIGLLNMQTKGREDLKIAASNFFATAVQRKVFARSTVNFLFVNKQDFKSDAATGKNLWEQNPNAFNRILGIDYNLASKDGLWQGKAFVHRSFTPTPPPNGSEQPYAAAAAIKYNNTNFNFSSSYETVGKGYAGNATGYVPRSNYYRTEPKFNFVFYPKSKYINSWSVGMDGDVFWRLSDQHLTDYDYSPIAFNLFFKNNSSLSIIPIRWDYTYLFNAFDPTNTGGKQLPKGTVYSYPSFRWAYNSNSRKLLSFKMQGRIGQYFNGNIQAINTTLTYRWQPYGLFSLDVNYNKIDLPSGFNDRQLLLVSPRFDFSFTRNVSFTTFLQYNNQVNNVNLNARFQWRFAPVSDLFIVYTHNYFAEDDTIAGYRSFDSKNRALVLKCTYWLNL
jgi:hypothetical protein